MYKVIIIDDESIIVEGLQKVVDWQRFGCEVVACASDAKSGAIAIREHSPDILFTDIKMPNMDGLTMLTGLRGEYPCMQITVLTGYRDFEYAKRAITLGVTRFLLKPSKMSKIEEALCAMTERLRAGGAEKSAPTAPAPTEQGDCANSFVVRNALAYIDAHYTEKLTLTELAQKVYVSQWYLSKLLNKYAQQSFNDILNGRRVEKSKELLRDPSLRIHEISDMMGFGEVTHFSKIFKKICGVSPNEYRNSSL